MTQTTAAPALMKTVIDDLVPDPEKPTLRLMIEDALDAFVTKGAREASLGAMKVMEAAEKRVTLLEKCTDDEERHQRQTSFRALRELDLALFESDTLANLLALGSRGDEPGENIRPLGDLFQRLTNWLVIHEGNPVETEQVEHLTLRMRRLRTMLHLVDADGRRVDDRPELLRQRRMLTAQVLLGRVREDHPNPLRRALCASAARASDALVRMEAAEVSDIVLAAGRMAQTPADLQTMAEASMVPDIESALRAYANLVKTVDGTPAGGAAARAGIDALAQLGHDLPIASSPRVEALRASLLDLVRALEPIAAASSLRELEEDARGDSALAHLEHALQDLAQLVVGSKRRFGEINADERPAIGSVIRLMDIYIERRFRDAETDLYEPLATALQTLQQELPVSLANIVAMVMGHIPELPPDGPRRSRTSFRPAAAKEAPMPAWMPPSRTLGGFYVTRAIGSGAVGSVFVAKRNEARNDLVTELFALKVPEYSGAAARTLSEEEFLQLFRQEAGALLALPEHPNIARFVTFDAGARPKPILVMEYVEGANLERIVETRDLTMPRAVDLLAGLAAGLEAMHGAGVAHLDLKPSNVIVRGAASKDKGAAALVDFGLAGRHLRPGCGTANYGAPEVWGHDESGQAAAPPADVYAFGCLTYELMTGKTLFAEANDLATIAAHLHHDGMPENVGRLSEDPRTAGFAEVVRRSIRRNANDRVTMSEIRAALERVRPSLEQLQWPIEA